MASSHRPSKEAEIPEVIEAFNLIIARQITGEFQLFKDSTN